MNRKARKRDCGCASATLVVVLLAAFSAVSQTRDNSSWASDPTASTSHSYPHASEAARRIRVALAAFQQTTNFSAAVDVDTIDRQAAPAQTTRAKESWKFSRVGSTNTFIRARFTPVAGRERIESTSYSGGRLLAGVASAAMPPDASLPGFEALNLLSELLAAGPVIESREAGSLIISAKLASGQTLRAWFPERGAAPTRIERYQDGALALVLTRTDAAPAGNVLPLHDALHLYQSGRVTTSVLRSYSNVTEFPAQNPKLPGQPEER